MDIKILMIDDEEKNTSAVFSLFNDEQISGNVIKIEVSNDFDTGKAMLFKNDYDIVILDIYKGKPSEDNPNKDGEEILAEIKTKTFIPVIFFSGLPSHVEYLKSDIIRVVPKSADGNNLLKGEIESLLASGIPMIKRNLVTHLQDCAREYFWEFIQKDWAGLSKIKDNLSIGYLLARRIAKSFSKSNVKKILGDHKISEEKIYPMELYIYPIHNDSIESGEILKKDGLYYVVVTPSCDIAQKKTEYLHLAKCVPLEQIDEYKDYISEKAKTPLNKNKLDSLKDKLAQLIRSGRRDCHFFIPQTNFIGNMVIDFEQLSTLKLSEADTFERIAKLDSPFAQSMIIKFIRHYNRIGTEDLDADYIINNLG